MGIFGAMTTAVSGLRAQSFALEHISDNIANSQTIGFKRTETSFMDVVSPSNPRRQQSGAVAAFTRATNDSAGDLLSSEIDTNLAVNGDGYFVVAERVSFTDGKPVFNGVTRYTRRGDFSIDRDGYLVNGAGYYLKGNSIDALTGNPAGGVPTVIKFSNDFLAAKPTTAIDYRLNLPKYPRTTNAQITTPNSELISATTMNGAGDIVLSNEDIFLKESISGGATTVYDAGGGGVNVQFRWAKTDNTGNKWNLYYLTDGTTTTPTDVKWKKAGEYEFDATSKKTVPTGDLSIAAMTVNGNALGAITLKHGNNGVTQFADSNGVAIVNSIDQNGYSAGELSGIQITGKGRVAVTYTNGQVVEKSEISLAAFKADAMLRKLNGSAFVATAESGIADLNATGKIVANQLESSNTDIAEEFSKLIVTQQAYAAGTRIVTTANEMLQEVINMKR